MSIPMNSSMLDNFNTQKRIHFILIPMPYNIKNCQYCYLLYWYLYFKICFTKFSNEHFGEINYYISSKDTSLSFFSEKRFISWICPLSLSSPGKYCLGACYAVWVLLCTNNLSNFLVFVSN